MSERTPAAAASGAPHYFSRQCPLAAEDLHSAGPAKAWFEVTVQGRTLEFATAAGVFSRHELDEGSRILLETADLSASRRVCDLGCGWGAMGCFAAALNPRGHVWMVDINGRASQLARFNAQRNRLTNTSMWCGDGLAATRTATFDAILCNPPVRAGNTVIGQLFVDAARCLGDSGMLWVVLRTAQGAKSWQRRLAELFGNCDTVEIKHGYRILRSARAACKV